MPSRSCSRRRSGGGFTMSNPRKSIKPSKRDFHEIGTAISVMNWPATSSMTTHWGSFEPLARDAKVAAGIPMTTASRASRIAAQGCQYAPIQRVISHHNTTVAAEAQVPGPGRSRPMPKNVATRSAQRGAAAAPLSRMSLLEPALENSALCFIDSSAGVLAGCRAGVPPAPPNPFPPVQASLRRVLRDIANRALQFLRIAYQTVVILPPPKKASTLEHIIRLLRG